MRKIELSIESLRVESFTTSAVERGKGTVFAHDKTLGTCANTCSPCPSAIDACPSVYGATLPCNGCVGTELC
jgi:hypothetical protein